MATARLDGMELEMKSAPTPNSSRAFRSTPTYFLFARIARSYSRFISEMLTILISLGQTFL